MSEDPIAAFRSAPGYEERSPDTFELRGLDFEGRVIVRDGTPILQQELPTLDGAVVGETVAAVVEEGWLETFRRRVTDVTGATGHEIGDPAVEQQGQTVEVRIPIKAGAKGPEAARHAATFVEATWVEGIVPGYEYEPRVQAIRDRAHSTGDT
ncbi:MAG: DUF5813 family protein [Halodesulfurarchaeum sp.]